MNREEALSLLHVHIDKYRKVPHAELPSKIGHYRHDLDDE